jgi:hypothetical protein
MKIKTIFSAILFSLILVTLLSSSENYNDNWPHWRGPNADGVSLTGAPPIEWSETKNIKSKTPIPGKGLSTPVIRGDQIFITTAVELDQKATKEAIKRLKKSSPAILKLLRMSKTTEHFQQFVVYSINRKGTCTVIKEGAEFKVIAHNKLDDNFDASPAIVGRELILRGYKNLYCIAE